METATGTDAIAARERLNADIACVAAGDRRALERVYAATSNKLFGICLRIAGDREAAEDALQETYLRVWRRAGRFDATRASAITWLCLIARGTAIDARRADGRRMAGALSLVDGAGDGTDRAAEIEGDVLRDCLDRLDTEPRGAILAAFYDGYSYDDLARRAGSPLGTMKSRIRRALKALRECIDG